MFDVANDPNEMLLILAMPPYDYSGYKAIETIKANYKEANKRLRVRVLNGDGELEPVPVSAGAIAAGCTPILGIDCDHKPLQLWAANCAPAGRATCATLGTDEPVEWPAAEPDIHIHLSPPCTSLSKARAGSAPTGGLQVAAVR